MFPVIRFWICLVCFCLVGSTIICKLFVSIHSIYTVCVSALVFLLRPCIFNNTQHLSSYFDQVCPNFPNLDIKINLQDLMTFDRAKEVASKVFFYREKWHLLCSLGIFGDYNPQIPTI